MSARPLNVMQTAATLMLLWMVPNPEPAAAADPGVDDPALDDLTHLPFITIDEVHSRAAAGLVSSPFVSAVGLIDKAPPKSWGRRATKISDASGFDVLVGPGDTIPNVTPDGSGTITFAGLTGLARALATRLSGARITGGGSRRCH